MKFTLGEIRGLEESLVKIMNKEIPVKAAYKLGKFLKKVSKELVTIEEQRISLVKKYSKGENEKGDFQVLSEKENDFRKEFVELLQTEVNIDVQTVSIEDFGDISLSPVDLMKLDKIVVSEENKE